MSKKCKSRSIFVEGVQHFTQWLAQREVVVWWEVLNV